MSKWGIVSQTVAEDRVRGIVLLMIVATMCYMYATAMEVPSELIGVAGIVLGYYFGRGVENGKANTG